MKNEESFQAVTQDSTLETVFQIAQLMKKKQINGAVEMWPLEEYVVPVEAAGR